MYDPETSIGSVPGYGVAEIVSGKFGDGHAVFPFSKDPSFLIVRGVSELQLSVILVELAKFQKIAALAKSDPENRLFCSNSVIIVGVKPPMESELLPAAPCSPRIEKIRRIKSVLLRREVFDRAVELYGNVHDGEDGAAQRQHQIEPIDAIELVVVKMPYHLVASKQQKDGKGGSFSPTGQKKPKPRGFAS
jgi:hypothetical protein